MADEHDGLPGIPQGPEVGEELVGLLRSEDGRRLVEDEKVNSPVQSLQDLDALLLPDRELLDQRAGAHTEAVPRGELRDLGVGSLHIEERSTFGTEDDVLGDREAVHQHEVLVDHADAERDRVAGRVDPYVLTRTVIRP